MKKLPVDVGSFLVLRGSGYLYVDKTQYIYDLVNKGRFYFLSRPRRFGKTLLISTFKELFLGNKELFENLWISTSNYSWEKHPVIHIDFSTLEGDTSEALKASIIERLDVIADSYGVTPKESPSMKSKLIHLISELSAHNRLAVLIDEYDRPLLQNIPHKRAVAEANREILGEFFATLKGLDEHLRFVFVTGVTKFARASIFSGANNLNDISLKKQAATLLGYTHDELITHFADHIKHAAREMELSEDEVKHEMTEWYNGYCFARGAAKVYNPFSILYYLEDCELNNYWAHSGTPSFLTRLMRNSSLSLENIEETEFSEISLGSFETDKVPFETILFQAGYLTITGYDRNSRTYRLGYPNQEVEQSFKKFLLTYFADASTAEVDTRLSHFKQALAANNMQRFCETMQIMLAGIPYSLHEEKESYYHSLFHVLAYLLDCDVHSEVMTSKGRIDLVITRGDHIYIFEFKFQGTAQAALEQIDTKRYAEKFQLEGKQITRVGLTFNFKDKQLDLDWMIA